jgi:hypothetical protein
MNLAQLDQRPKLAGQTVGNNPPRGFPCASRGNVDQGQDGDKPNDYNKAVTLHHLSEKQWALV